MTCLGRPGPGTPTPACGPVLPRRATPPGDPPRPRTATARAASVRLVAFSDVLFIEVQIGELPLPRGGRNPRSRRERRLPAGPSLRRAVCPPSPSAGKEAVVKGQAALVLLANAVYDHNPRHGRPPSGQLGLRAIYKSESWLVSYSGCGRGSQASHLARTAAFVRQTCVSIHGVP